MVSVKMGDLGYVRRGRWDEGTLLVPDPGPLQGEDPSDRFPVLGIRCPCGGGVGW